MLRPGEVVPADGVVLSSKVFFVSQAPLTGEALPVEKYRITEAALEIHETTKDSRRKSVGERVLHAPISKTKRFFRLIFGLKVSTEAQLDAAGFELKEDLSSFNNVRSSVSFSNKLYYIAISFVLYDYACSVGIMD